MAMWERNEADRGSQGEIGRDEGRGTGAVRSQSGRCPCQHAGTVGVEVVDGREDANEGRKRVDSASKPEAWVVARSGTTTPPHEIY